jgi:F-type H+-transporting ATPase subunit epsilon
MPLDVSLVTPERVVWSGEARLVVARGVEGDVGVLVNHAPLLIRLAIGPLRILREGEEEVSAVVDGGFMHVTSAGGATRVDVLAPTASLRSEIDPEIERRRADEMERRLAEGPDAEAQAELSRATARIELAG